MMWRCDVWAEIGHTLVTVHQCFAYLEVDWTVEQNEIGQVWQMKFKMFLTGVIDILVEIEIYFVLSTKLLIFCLRCLNFFFLNSIECKGWRRHSSLIFLILLFTKPNIEFSGWLFQTKTHITYIVYQPFSKVTPPN